MDGIDFRAWAIDMCSLLDEIERHHDDIEAVHNLCQIRFDLARKHGIDVLIEGPGQMGSA